MIIGGCNDKVVQYGSKSVKASEKSSYTKVFSTFVKVWLYPFLTCLVSNQLAIFSMQIASSEVV